MNQFALNGAAINGSAGLSIVQASADFSLGVTVSVFTADSTRVQFGIAPAVASATTTALQTHTQAGDAGFGTTTYLTAAQTHQQAAYAAATAGAGLVSFVLRTVQADAAFGGNAAFVPIPASIVGEADPAASATVTAVGTPVLPGNAAWSVGCTTSAVALVTRYVTADITPVLNLNVEGTHNGTHDTFANVIGTSDLTPPDAGLLFRMAAADMGGSVVGSGNGTQIQPGYADESVGANVTVAPFGLFLPTADVTGGAATTAFATRVVVPTAALTGDSGIALTASMKFAAAATPAGGADVTPNVTRFAAAAVDGSNGATVGAGGVIVRPGSANFVASAQLDNAGNFTVTPSAAATGDVTFIADGAVTRGAAADISPSSNVVPIGVAFRMSAAAVAAGADSQPSAEIFQLSTAIFSAGANTAGAPMRNVLPDAAIVTGVNLAADARTNVDAIDPPWRTVSRRYRLRELYRPYTERKFKRAA